MCAGGSSPSAAAQPAAASSNSGRARARSPALSSRSPRLYFVISVSTALRLQRERVIGAIYRGLPLDHLQAQHLRLLQLVLLLEHDRVAVLAALTVGLR